MITAKDRLGLMLVAASFMHQAAAIGVADPISETPPAVWGSELRIPYENGDTFTSALTSTPDFAVMGQTVWNLRKGQQESVQLEGAPMIRLPSAVSIDGTLFASVLGADNVFEQDKEKRLATASVVVWSISTGQPVATLKCGSVEGRPRIVAFSGPSSKALAKWLVVIGPNDRSKDVFNPNSFRADVWDLAANKVHHSFLMLPPANNVVTMSPDGGYLGVIAHDHVHVYDIRAGREAAVMRDPPADPIVIKPFGAAKSNAEETQPKPVHRVPPINPATLPRFKEYVWSGGLAFSPNGHELAGLFSGWMLHKPNRLIIWDSSGHVTFDSAGRQIAGDFGGNPEEGFFRNVQWSPDGSQLLLTGGWLVDRKTGTSIWHVVLKDGERPQPVFLDDHRLLAPRTEAWEPCEIPLSDIKASLAALSNPKVEALLRPGQQVSLSVDVVGNLRGDAGQTKENLTKAMTAGLAAASFTVADAQTATFHISYQESAGITAEVYQSHSMFPIRGTDTGQKATGTNSTVTIELKINGSDQPIWSQQLKSYSPQAMSGSVNDDALRTATFNDICWKLNRLNLPTFVPVDPSIKSLPIVTD